MSNIVLKIMLLSTLFSGSCSLVYAEVHSTNNLNFENHTTSSTESQEEFSITDLPKLALGVSALAGINGIIASQFPNVTGVVYLIIAPLSYIGFNQPSDSFLGSISSFIFFAGLGAYNLSVNERNYDKEKVFIDNFLFLSLGLAIPITLGILDNDKTNNLSFHAIPLPQGGTAIGLNYQF